MDSNEILWFRHRCVRTFGWLSLSFPSVVDVDAFAVVFGVCDSSPLEHVSNPWDEVVLGGGVGIVQLN